MMRTHLLSFLWLLAAVGVTVQAACEAPIQLRARTQPGQLQLTWKPDWTQTAWRVVSSLDPGFPDSTILGVTLNPAWNWQLQANEPRRFFRVRAVDGPPLPPEVQIEAFEWMPVLNSWSGEDMDPAGWNQDLSQSAEGAASLRLFGNTVKSQQLGGPQLDFGTTLRVSARVSGVADRQMIGFADSLNVMWYVLWGQRGGYGDTPGQSGQVEVSCYQGWFPENEWIQALLPVGQDWMGKYGYLPTLCQVLWANESDNHAGMVWFDDLRRVDISSSGPLAQPQWESLGQVGDSLNVRLWVAEAPETSYLWNLGDGRSVSGADVSIRLWTGREHHVTLLAQDAQGRWDLGSTAVPGGAGVRRARLAFAGDMMTARAYEAAGGIIQTQGVDAIFDSVRVALQTPDLTLVNLECPYTTATTEHPTKSITFKSRPENLVGVANAHVDMVSLANNHSMDYMEAGMQETMEGLDALGLPYSGSGMNTTWARRPVQLSANGLSVGVAAFCDRTGNYNNAQPFLEAGLSRPGFSMWSRGDMQAVIADMRDEVDVLALLVHSGNEYSESPSLALSIPHGAPHEDQGSFPPMDGAQIQADEGLPWNPDQHGLFARELLPDQSERSLRREAVDLGAPLVITHHPHIVQGFEAYHGGLIAHSLGNFVMDLSYQETMPSVLLEVETEEDALISAWITPVFIENLKPRVCRGETASLLLDHVSRISRPFDTWVFRQPGSGKAWVALDTLGLAFTDTILQQTASLQLVNGWYTSAPLRLGGEGELAVMRLLDLMAGAQVRLGRNQCWWGNMENEGAGLWDINSAQEGFVTDQAMRGARSLRLTEQSGNTVYTYYTVRAPLDYASSWSLSGWLSTQNANSATLQMRYYQTRTGDLLSSTTLPAVTGTAGWSQVWQDLSLPGNTNFYQMRLGLAAPTQAAQAWFDDVSLVEWNAWQNLPQLTPLTLSTPNDLQWMQIRFPAAAASAQVEWTRRVCVNPPVELVTP